MATPIQILDRFLSILPDDDAVKITLEILREGVLKKDPEATEEARLVLEGWAKNRPKSETGFADVIDDELESTHAADSNQLVRAGFGLYDDEGNNGTGRDNEVGKGVRSRSEVRRSDSSPKHSEPTQSSGASLLDYLAELERDSVASETRSTGTEEGLYGEGVGREGGKEETGQGQSVGYSRRRAFDGLSFFEDGAGAEKRFSDITYHELLDDIPYESEEDELYSKGRRNEPIKLDLYPHLPGLEDPIKVMGLDVSGYGDDKTTLLMRHGCHVIDIQSYSQMNPMEIVGYVLKMIEEHSPDEIVIDITGGWGLGVSSRLRELDELEDKVTIAEVEFQSSPRDESLKVRNARAEMYVILRELFLNGRISLPPDKELLEELSWITYTTGSTGLLEITSKKEIKKKLGRSPDKADCLALSFYQIGDLEVF